MTFGKAIKAKREALGMTQRDLAEKLFVSRQTVCRWENGSRCPDLIMSKKISMVLGIPMDDLVPTGEDLSKYASTQENRFDVSCVKVMLAGIVLMLIGIYLLVADDYNMDASAWFFFGGIIIFIVGLFIPQDGGKPIVDEDLPQRKCAKCGKDYDFDYPRCPFCGNPTERERIL